jgi:hypothetical protein
MTQFDYPYLREIVAEIKPLGAATGTKTSAFALQAGVSVACRQNVSSSRVIVCRSLRTGVCPPFPAINRCPPSRQRQRASMSREQTIEPQSKKRRLGAQLSTPVATPSYDEGQLDIARGGS